MGKTTPENPEGSSDYKLTELTPEQVQNLIKNPRAKEFQDARAELNNLILKPSKSIRTERGEIVAGSVEDQMFELIQVWENTLINISAEATRNGETLSQLREKEAEIYKKMDQFVFSTKIMVQNLLQDGKISPEILAQLHDNIYEVTKVFSMPEYKALTRAGYFAMGATPEEGRTLDSFKDEAFKALDEEFNKKEYGSVTTKAAFYFLILMRGQNREEFTEQYLENKSAEEKKAFLVAGNKVGVYSEQEIAKYSGLTLSLEEREQYAKIYELTSKFPQIVAHMQMGKGISVDDITIGNIFEHVLVPTYLWTTIGANSAVSLFSGGKLNSLPVIVENLLNPYNVGSATAIVGLKTLRGEETILTPATNKTTYAKSVSEIMKTSPVLNDLLKNDDGAGVMAAYVRSCMDGDKLLESLVTPESLKEYLAAQMQKAPDQRDPKGADFESLSRLLDNGVIDREKLKKLASNFRKLDLTSGDRTIARRDFKEVLALANPTTQ